MRRDIVGLALAGAVLATAWAQEPQPARVLSARDTLRIARVADPSISPTGDWAVYAQTSRDLEEEEMKPVTHVWRSSLDGSQRRQLTFGPDSCSSPAWFPDGRRIAFLSSRNAKKKEGDDNGGGKQIFALYLDGGEAWPLTRHEEEISSFAISPDGKRIAFTARDPLSKEEKERKKKKDDAEVVDEKVRFNHLWVYDLESGKSERLTQGAFTVFDPQWSPASDRIAYVRRPNAKFNESWKSDIWLFNLDGKSERLLYENPGRDSNPRWSPDGKTLAFASEPTPGTNTWHSRLLLVPLDGGPARTLLGGFDLDFQSPVWARDGRTIYFSAGEKTIERLFAVDLQSGRVSALDPPRGGNDSWELSRDGTRWIWRHDEAQRPAEIWTASLLLQNPVRLSDANPWLLHEGVQLGTVEVIRWKNSDGQEVEGILTKPVGFQEGKKYPLILNPHGGPTSVVTESFYETSQFFAGNGFLVLQPNFRGSSNYGQEFMNANRGYWGVRDYDDCMTGVDYVIERGWADPERLICYGWSYGGYLSFWIATQTDRFKAVSPGAGLSNLYSMYGTTDVPHYLGWFFGSPADRGRPLGTPWDFEDAYLRLSPIRHVKKVTAPILILHGANDKRVPLEQASEFYQALRDLNKEVILVVYPREGHGFQEARHLTDRLRRYLFFFSEKVGLEPVSEKKEDAVGGDSATP